MIIRQIIVKTASFVAHQRNGEAKEIRLAGSRSIIVGAANSPAAAWSQAGESTSADILP